MQERLAQASRLMIAKQSNKAIDITNPILKKLKADGTYNSPFGLRARLIHGSALIHADTSEASYDFLWELKDDSRAAKQWTVFAETCRVIASVLEYAERKEQSLSNLNEARAVIRQHDLDSIYPHFAVRISSWHRVFGSRDSSIYFAEEAIRTAHRLGNKFEEAEGYLLLGLNAKGTNSEEAIFNKFSSQFESLAASRQVAFSYETTIGNEVSANIDREKCRQVLHNLLSNAFKNTPAGGRVNASLALSDDNMLTLKVSDRISAPANDPNDSRDKAPERNTAFPGFAKPLIFF